MYASSRILVLDDVTTKVLDVLVVMQALLVTTIASACYFLLHGKVYNKVKWQNRGTHTNLVWIWCWRQKDHSPLCACRKRSSQVCVYFVFELQYIFFVSFWVPSFLYVAITWEKYNCLFLQRNFLRSIYFVGGSLVCQKCVLSLNACVWDNKKIVRFKKIKIPFCL